MQGFPFDEESFGRRTGDIRSHLDDLAARHPEFADHLLGPPWADVPFGGGTGSLHRNRNRRASTDRNASNNHHHYPEEDNRSQTSSSAGSTGTSGSEPEQSNIDSNNRQQQPVNKINPGSRNHHTLDIGQHQHDMMENPQQRNVRSMSAPPENRNNQSNDQSGNPRFVSRVDINPQVYINQFICNFLYILKKKNRYYLNLQKGTTNQTNQQTQREKSPASQQGNVRHIPIFVEGRDEPVVAKNNDRRVPTQTQQQPFRVDQTDFVDFPTRRQQSPPQFHRPSHFNNNNNKHPTSSWSNFPDSFFDNTTSQWPPRHPREHDRFGSMFKPTEKPPRTTQQQPWEPPQMRRQAPQQPQSEPETLSKPKVQIQPKDPLGKKTTTTTYLLKNNLLVSR